MNSAKGWYVHVYLQSFSINSFFIFYPLEIFHLFFNFVFALCPSIRVSYEAMCNSFSGALFVICSMITKQV